MAAQRPNALAHGVDAGAGHGGLIHGAVRQVTRVERFRSALSNAFRTDPVVLDAQPDPWTVAFEPHLASARAGVADHVGDTFAQRQREHALGRGREEKARHVVVERHAGSLQRELGVDDLALQALAAVTAHGDPHLRQGVAGDPFDVAHLLLGTGGVTLRQPCRQFRLQRDGRQRVAEQVVQVARDALALGDRRQMLDLVLRHAELGVRPRAFGLVDAGEPEQRSEDEYRHEGEPAVRRVDRGDHDGQ